MWPNPVPLSMHAVSELEINLSAIDHNMAVLRSIVGKNVALCPVVKADAYGLGARRIAKRLNFCGAAMMAVYSAAEAADLLSVGVSGDMLVLMPIDTIDRTDDLYRGLITGRLHLTAHDGDHLDALISLADQFAVQLPVHLEVDTGMGRAGVTMDDATDVLQRIADHRRLRLAGLMTHFATADTHYSRAEAQLKTFVDFVKTNKKIIPKDCRLHAANTHATLRDAKFHGTMVRVGIGWAGLGTERLSGKPQIAAGNELRGIVRWRSQLIQIKRVSKDQPVGYGAQWTAKRDSIIGIVPVGFADGYPVEIANVDPPGSKSRSKKKTTPARRTGRKTKPAVVGVMGGNDNVLGHAPVVGRVSMDQITIDLTTLVNKHGAKVQRGQAVELISPESGAPNTISALAKAAEILPYRLMCGLNPRIPRTYTTSGMASPAMERTARPAAPTVVEPKPDTAQRTPRTPAERARA